jgi:hypothetical protein
VASSTSLTGLPPNSGDVFFGLGVLWA